MLNTTKIFLAFIMLGACAGAFAVEGESIVFNPATGNYQINHYSPIDKKFEQLIFIPATKINPTLKIKLKSVENGTVHYEYKLTSGPDSQQNIVHIILDPVSSVTSSLPDIPLNAPPGKIMGDMMNVAKQFDTPKPWLASLAYSDGQKSFRIGWRTLVAQGMKPSGQAIFGFNSRDLPSIIQAEIYGYAPGSQQIDGEELPDANDGGFGQQYFALLNNNFIRRNAAVPTIAVSNPFDAATLLGNIQTQMHTWIGMKLLDATFSSQLDRYFQSAINAYRLNQPKVGKQQIETIRALVKKEQPDLGRDEEHESDRNHEKDDDRKSLIDRLAARVLDFDLDYVLERMEGDHHGRD